MNKIDEKLIECISLYTKIYSSYVSTDTLLHGIARKNGKI